MLTAHDYLTRVAMLPRQGGGFASQPKLERDPAQARAGPPAPAQRALFVSGKPIRPMSRHEAIARALDHAETYLLTPPQVAQVVCQAMLTQRPEMLIGKHIHAVIVDELAQWPKRPAPQASAGRVSTTVTNKTGSEGLLPTSEQVMQAIAMHKTHLKGRK
jgi:hypothetical protein